MTWVLIGLAILAVLVIIGFVVSSAKKKQAESKRHEAARIRARAADQEIDLREQQAAAAHTQAQAQAARADAELKAAEAERQRVEAERLEGRAADEGDRHSVLQEARDEELRRADALDPDVRTDKHGNRVDDGVADERHDGDRDGDGYRDGVVESEDSYADSSPDRRDDRRATGAGATAAAGTTGAAAGTSGAATSESGPDTWTADHEQRVDGPPVQDGPPPPATHDVPPPVQDGPPPPPPAQGEAPPPPREEGYDVTRTSDATAPSGTPADHDLGRDEHGRHAVDGHDDRGLGGRIKDGVDDLRHRDDGTPR
ncbi:hypothetical protein L6241_15620 [Janibacter sp. Y6]|uniref:hypothetical protein n=1 Tax=Janibacter sp. Y6 TaxID=2913552 RepID=UPI0034A56FE2